MNTPDSISLKATILLSLNEEKPMTELAPMPKYKRGKKSCAYHIVKIIDAVELCPKSKILQMMPAESLTDHFTRKQIVSSLGSLIYHGKVVQVGQRYRRATLAEFEARQQELKGTPEKKLPPKATVKVVETTKVVEHGIHFAQGAAVAGIAILIGLAIGVFL